MSYKIEKITESLLLGESPHWDLETRNVYLVDILGKAILRYTPSENSYAKVVLDKTVSFVIPVEEQADKFVIGYGNELALITWDGKSDKISSLETLVALQNDSETTHQWNDGKADSLGRLWAGVIYPSKTGGFDFDKGSLWGLRKDSTLKTLVSPISLSNGLAWNYDIKKFYYIDSKEFSVYQFDYSAEDWEISNRQIVFSSKEQGIPGNPDGLTIDTGGNLWVSIFGGGRILKIDPKRPGTVLQTIELPVTQVTCAAFGGPNLDELYVTTGSFPVFGGPASEVPEEGATYKITGLGAQGLPPYKVKL